MIKRRNNFWLEADWPAPNNIRAGTSTRMSGYSRAPYNKSNLSFNVGDDPNDVKKNRAALLDHLILEDEPVWLEQKHGERVLSIDETPGDIEADASYTTRKNRVCVVTTADCVPILFCNNKGTKVAAIHAGWKGICKGIIENTVNIFERPESILAWIGPCIGSKYYEIDEDVYSSFLDYSITLESSFKKINEKKWSCCLNNIVKILLKNTGIHKIYGCDLCVYEMDNLFFSHRRDGNTGRTATMIWIT